MRYVPTRQQKKSVDGKKLCKVCLKPIPKRRSSYCSDECWLRNTPSMLRVEVFKRDKGICSLCNTKSLSAQKWQADHIVPVAEGGGLCGLDGYRTLCSQCHGVETGKLRKRLNESKRSKPLLENLK